MADENLQNLEKKVAGVETSLAEMTKRAETAERELRVAKLSDVEKTAFNALSKADQEEYHTCKDDKCRNGIMAKGQATIEKANAVPEHIQKQFDDIKKQLEASETKRLVAEAAITKAQDETALVRFSKQASIDLPNLPGTSEENGAILKTLNDKLTAEEFGKVLTLLKAGNASHATLMESVGKGTGATASGNSAMEKINAKAKELIGKSNTPMSESQAISKVLEDPANAKLYTDYLQEGSRQ